jgi:pilus assembly protein Flp/PilA
MGGFITMMDLMNSIYIRLTSEREEGQGMVEYGLIIALVAIIVIAALVILGPKIADIFNKASASLG